jgi:VWFA-related protein
VRAPRKYTALLLLLGSTIPAQTVGTVLVDAVVTSQTGEPVHGLAANDFHLFEDGQEQVITAFQAHAGPAGPGMSQQQLFALLIAPQSPDDQKWIQQAAAKFIADNAGPNRRIAIIYTDACYGTISTPFAGDAAQLQQALSDWPDLLYCPNPPDPSADLHALYYAQVAKSLAQVPGHKMAALFPAHTEASAVGAGKASAPTAAPARRARARGEAKTEEHEDPFDMELEFRRADVSVYPVEAQDGVTHPRWALSLAEATGGHELSRGAAAGVFEQLVREQDASYTLAYAPKVSGEGSCHPLKVTVNRSDLTVRGRNLYCNVSPVSAAAAKPRENDLESLAASPDAGNTAASVSAPFFYEAGGAARVHLALEIPAPAFDSTEVNGKVRAEMDVLGLAYVPGGAVVARFTHKAKFDFDSRRQFDDFVRRPLHYERQFEVAPGNYQFKVVFRTAKDHFGVVETPLAVDPFNAAQLGVSAIALSRDVQPISEEAAQDAIEQGKSLLMFRGNRIAVSGSDTLSKTGPAEAYFEIYEPLAGGTAAVQLTMRLRVADATSNAQVWDSGDVDLSALAKSGVHAIPVGLRLPVSMLAPGAYRAELTVKDSAGGHAARSVQFRVE